MLIGSIVVLYAAIHISTGYGMDKHFCQTNAPPPKDKSFPFPVMPDDFTMTYESGFSNNNLTYTNHIIYSTTSQKIYYEYHDHNLHVRRYIDVEYDQVLSFSTTDNFESCEAHPLYASQDSFIYPVNVTKGGRMTLEPMTYPMIVSSQSGDTVYAGETFVRGILADQWNVCLYSHWSEETMSANFYFSSDDVRMPGSKQPIPLKVEAKISNNITGEIYVSRLDFMKFTTNISKEDEIASQIPANKFCDQTRVSHNLPVPPTTFHFKMEKMDFGDDNSGPRPATIVSHFEKTYVKEMETFSVKSESLAKDGTVNKHMILQDFYSDLEYALDLVNDHCDVRRIDVSRDHVVSMKTDVTKMESPSQFFDLTSKTLYHYAGEHKHTERGVDVDVFTSMDQNNVLHSWSFASKNWMLKTMGLTQYQMVPVQYKIGTSSSIDIYHFTSSPSDSYRHPDMSLCFPQGKTIHVNITLQVTLENARRFQTFQADVRQALLNHSSLTTSIRITRIKLLPKDVVTVVVGFQLLEKRYSAGHEHGLLDRGGPDNMELYRQIKNAVKSGHFFVDFNKSSKVERVKAVNIEMRQDISFPTTKEQGSGNTAFTTASYVGLGVGAFLVGIVLGFAVFKLARKLGRPRSGSVAWQNLIESSVSID